MSVEVRGWDCPRDVTVIKSGEAVVVRVDAANIVCHVDPLRCIVRERGVEQVVDVDLPGRQVRDGDGNAGIRNCASY